jgi:glutathione synthase/RimK-type ligase-like ATP-grasp enzyme
MILILTQPLDPHADLVTEKLRDRGADFVRFHPEDFPSRASISLQYSASGRLGSALCLCDRPIDLDALEAVWYRRPRDPVAHEEITDTPTRQAIAEECEPFVQDVWNSLGCRWVPAPVAVFRRAQFKASQLKVAANLGFEIPPTLITNNPVDFLEFYRRHGGRIVSKRVGFAFFSTKGAPFVRFTEVVSRRDVGYAGAVRYCPTIFQAYVPKRVELRITVVGRRAFAAEIHSQASNRTRHDWRRYDLRTTPHRPHELPPDVARRCVLLVRRLGLCFGTMDMVLTPDGRYVFLEINPNGQYLWIEHAAGLPISDAICDLLMYGPSAGEPEDATDQDQEARDERIDSIPIG